MDKNENVNNLDDTLDWEYMSDFYTNEEKEVGSLEDYMVEEKVPESAEDMAAENQDDTLSQIMSDIKKVREYNDHGKTVSQIADLLERDEDYITLILMTVNSNPQDSNDLAIAHLVELG